LKRETERKVKKKKKKKTKKMSSSGSAAPLTTSEEYNRRGVAYESRNRLDAAMADYTKAIELKATNHLVKRFADIKNKNLKNNKINQKIRRM
jgi:hypothetical protein